ncbi:MAG: ABC transporter substrate-binding protein [Alphaproteobacteria bacterium]
MIFRLIAWIARPGALGLAAIAWLILAPVAAGAVEDAPPRNVVETYYAALDKVLRNAKTLGFAGRYKALDPAIAASFDIRFMARVAVGHHWRKFAEDQQTSMTARMHGLSVATYASRFSSYAGEKFEVLASATTSRGDVLVRTQIIKSNGEPVKINYLLRKRDNGWRIIDVHLKGTISELARWRSDFSSILRRQGYDGLIAAIDKKIARLKAE